MRTFQRSPGARRLLPHLLFPFLLMSLLLAGCTDGGNASSNHPSPTAKRPPATARMVYASNRALLTAVNGATGAIAWQYHPTSTLAQFSGISDVSPAGRAIYVGTYDGSNALLLALQADSGRTIWTARLAFPGIPIGEAANGLLYIAGPALAALQPATGRQVWLARPDSGAFHTQPVLANKMIYIGGDDGLYAFEALTGKRVWKSAGATAVQSLAAARSLLYAASGGGARIVAVAAATGKVAWQYRAGAGIVGDLQAANGLVYFSTADNFVNALMQERPDLAWRTPIVQPGTPGVVEGSNLYLTGKAGTHSLVYALDRQIGKIVWQSDFVSLPLSKYRPRIAGLVYVARIGVHDEADGYISALDPANGRPIWQTEVSGGDDGELTPISAWCPATSLHCEQAGQNYT